jgi:Transposase IS66 family
VVARLREMILASTRIFADETVVPVLDPGRGRTKQGFFWAMARDDRPLGGSQLRAVVYSHAPGCGHTHANALLGGCCGILRCDGYAASPSPSSSNLRDAGLLLEPRASGLLRPGQGEGADRDGKPCSALLRSMRSRRVPAARAPPTG